MEKSIIQIVLESPHSALMILGNSTTAEYATPLCIPSSSLSQKIWMVMFQKQKDLPEIRRWQMTKILVPFQIICCGHMSQKVLRMKLGSGGAP